MSKISPIPPLEKGGTFLFIWEKQELLEIKVKQYKKKAGKHFAEEWGNISHDRTVLLAFCLEMNILRVL